MRLFFLSACCLILFLSFESDSGKYPQNYFASPVEHSLKLSGTFGELRPQHLHAGIDIKGAVGYPILAAADGFISRIKIQKGGYGKVLYIQHPNGYTTVYAHLDTFMPEVENYVKSVQYQKQRFEVEIKLDKAKFNYKKGTQIGTMGVTGRSFGPHLHFEIRETNSDIAINPLHFNLEVEDTRAPRLHEIKIYGLAPDYKEVETKTYSLIRRKNGDYRLSGDTVYINEERLGVAIKTYDRMDGVHNLNGIYEIEMLLDDSLHFQMDMESFPLNETRYINAHLDYEDFVENRSYFNKCFLLPGNQLSVYNHNKAKGLIETKANKSRKIEIAVSDIAGNTANLIFWVKKGRQTDKRVNESYNYLLQHNEENIINTPSVNVYFPKNTFYQKTYFNYTFSVEESEGIYSSVHHLHNNKTPVHKYFDLSIWPTKLPEEFYQKAFIAFCGSDNTIVNCGGQWNGDMLTTKVRTLGDYYVAIDNTPPIIEPVQFASNMRGRTQMSFRIKDNYAVAGNVKGLQYYATIDGQWILMSYDEKKDLITHTFDTDLSKGEHRLLLEVEDAMGNKTILDRIFSR
jgi:murein DD-endopeptidase MepM/ murein hydrolase activator NlpD